MVPVHCDFRWPLIDPNDEDRAHGITHWCRYPPGHDGDHRCACGAQPGDPE
jgi:hypothetical protein